MIDSFSCVGIYIIIKKSGFDFVLVYILKRDIIPIYIYILSLQNWILSSKYASYSPLCDLVYIGFAF